MFLDTPVKLLEDPVKNAQTLGAWIKQDGFLLVFGSVVLLFGIVFMSIWLRSYWQSTQCRCKQDKRRASDLITHPFFGSMDLYLRTKVLTLQFPEKGREAIFKDFLKFKFEVFINNTQEWLMKNLKELNTMDSHTLKNSIMILVAESVREYEQKAKDNGIPDIVLHKFRKFHDPQVEQVRQAIDNICDCEWLMATNNIERVAFIFQTLERAFEWTLINAELTLSDINGDLDGLVYKGITVQPFKRYRTSSESGRQQIVTH